jgi:hypothetical protein
MSADRFMFSGRCPGVGGSGPAGWCPPVPGSGVTTGDGDSVSSGAGVGVRNAVGFGEDDGCDAATPVPEPGLPSRAISASDDVSPMTVNAAMPMPTATTSRPAGPRYLGVG